MRIPRPPATTRGGQALIVSLLMTTLLGATVAGCGGSKKTSTSSAGTSKPASAASAGTSKPASAASATSAAPGGPSVTSGPVHGKLLAPNHAPIVGRSWPYTVKVTDAAGHPLSGTVDVEFVFGGQVVGRDTPPTHPVKNGHWSDFLKFPAAAVGQPLTFRTVVHTASGAIVLDWPITVQR